MKLYLAAQYSWKDQIKGYAKELEAAGYEITSTWLHERKGASTELTQLSNRFLREHAAIDLRDIEAADAVVFFSVGPTELTKRGGRHVEFGLAYALGKKIVVCGPKENIFHYLDDVIHFNNFEDLLKAVKEGKL